MPSSVCPCHSRSCSPHGASFSQLALHARPLAAGAGALELKRRGPDVARHLMHSQVTRSQVTGAVPERDRFGALAPILRRTRGRQLAPGATRSKRACGTRLTPMAAVEASSGTDEPSAEEGGLSVLELPCLPFIPAEVLVPASTKTLHLYEARYLAFLDDVVNRCQGLFAHVVLQPVKAGDERIGREGEAALHFVASRCCLTYIESVRKLEIGALVSVRGLRRLRLLSLTQAEPFLKGTLSLEADRAQEGPEEEGSTLAKVEELKEVLRDVQRLQIKVKASGDAPLQTPLEEAVQWAEKALTGRVPSLCATAAPGAPPVSADVDVSRPPWPSQTQPLQGLLPSRTELLPFAALQPMAGASPAELHRLLQTRLQSMDTTDCLQRLTLCREYAEESRAALAAKLALQSLAP